MAKTHRTAPQGKAQGKAQARRGQKGAGPFAAFEWMLALRYLRSRRRETFISVIAGISFAGIMLGVATLIVVMAVMNGFRTELLGKILGFGGHILVRSIDGDLTEFESLATRFETMEPVHAALPFIEGQALVSGPGGAFGVLVRGLKGGDLARLPILPGSVTQGSLAGFDASGDIAIGSRLAARLGLRLHDAVSLIVPRGTVSPLGVLPRLKSYRIGAIFDVGMSQYDSSVVFMPFAESQLFFNMENAATGIDLFIADPDTVGAIRPAIEPLTPTHIRLTDWRQRNLLFFSALEVERNVMFIILTLIILVAALNIVSGLTMLVKEKGRDIAVLRTMGATRGAVLRIFLIAGSGIGVTGTLCGLALGALICLNIETIQQFLNYFSTAELFSPELYFLSRLPADMDARETTLIIAMGCALSFLATLYPSWRAARLDPVEALRYE